MYEQFDMFKMGGGSNPTNGVSNEFGFTAAASNSSDDDYDQDFDLADILEDPFANLDDLDLSIESNLCLKEAKSDLNRDVTNQFLKSEVNKVEENPLSFLDDLPMLISNVDSIKDEDLIGQHETDIGIASGEVNDVLGFLTTANGDNFADLDFLNDIYTEAMTSESCQPPETYAAQTYDVDEDLSVAEVKFSNSDPEPIKSDCMWSSTLASNVCGDVSSSKRHHHKGRKRDVSLTLSECADGIMSITSMEMTGFAPLEVLSIDSGNSIEGVLLNTFSSETETDDSDEEVDVETPYDNVSDPLLQQHSHKPRLQKKSIEPGRSLLRCHNQSPPVQPPSMFNHQIFIDHNYFKMPLLPSPTKKPATENLTGILTPTESSDDDEICSKSRFPDIVVPPGKVDKQKIARALQSLINNSANDKPVSTNKRSASTFASDNVKFKFKMKFKSNSSHHSLLSINNQHEAYKNNWKSVSNVTLPKSSPLESKNLPRSVTATKPRSPVSGSSRSNSSTASSSISSPVEKCREIRDLHNSMERQRRVDLRQNFEQLKAFVPELADSVKASKLNILNKASNYCQVLTTLDNQLTSEHKLESAKNALLRRKLLCLQKSLK